MADSTDYDRMDTDVVDVSTDRGLQTALLVMETSQAWESALGRAVIDQVHLRARATASAVRRSCDVAMGDLVQALVGRGWEVLVTQREELIDVDRPWGVVVRAMSRAAARDARAAELLTSSSASRFAVVGGWHTARRFGLDSATVTDRANDAVADPTGEAAVEDRDVDGTAAWDPALRTLRDELVAAGAPPAMAVEVLAAALDVLSMTTRRSHVHFTAYRDERLTRMLNRAQIRALMDLLIGSRREGPEGSAWLALRAAGRSDQSASLLDAHPQSMSRVQTIAQAWALPAVAAAGLLDRVPA